MGIDIIGGNTLVFDDPDGLKPGECKGDASLVEVRVGPSVRAIPEEAFQGCPNLERVSLPDGLEAIRADAFHGCSRLKAINLPSTVRLIGKRAFSGCTALETIVLPRDLHRMEWLAFSGCSGLKGVFLPPNLQEVGSYVFSRCTGLERVDVFANVENRTEAGCFTEDLHGYYLFEHCDSLREVVVHEGVSTLPEGMFSMCHGIGTIRLPSTLKKAARYAFDSYRGRLVVLPEGFRMVCKRAFGEGNGAAVVPDACRVFCGCALRYRTREHDRLLDFLADGELRLAGKPFDANGFLRWFLGGADRFPERADDKSRAVLLEAMKGHSALLSADVFARADDPARQVLQALALRAVAEPRDGGGPDGRRLVADFCGRMLRLACPDEDGRRRKAELAAAMMSVAGPGGRRRFWESPAGRGRLPLLLEAVAGGDSAMLGEFERIEKLSKPSPNLPAGDLREAAVGGRFAEFMLRLPMHGLAMDERTVVRLFKCHATKCIVEAYAHDPGLERRLPLRIVLLAACRNWPRERAREFVECAEAAFPGLCAGTFDAFGCSPLWYCLLNRHCRSSDGVFDGRPLVPALLAAGCDPRKENRLGLSFEAIANLSRQ